VASREKNEMLAARQDRVAEGAPEDVREAVQELSKRLNDLKETAAAPIGAIGRSEPVSAAEAAATPAEAPDGHQQDLALVAAAVEAERGRASRLRGEIDQLVAQVAQLEEESRRVAQLRADREHWAAKARSVAQSLL
jgi:hypothetical protein